MLYRLGATVTFTYRRVSASLSAVCRPVSAASEVCFNELGCFANQPPWGGTAQRPAAVLPWQPEAIGTRFLLFTPKNRYYQARGGRSFFLLTCLWKPFVKSSVTHSPSLIPTS